MKYRKSYLAITGLLLLGLLAAGCSKKLHYTSEKDVVTYYKDAGYEVSETTEFDELKDINHVLAQKGDSFAEICYNVDENKCSDVCDKLSALHPNNCHTGYNAGEGVVYCFSDQDTYNISKFDTDLNIDVPAIQVH